MSIPRHRLLWYVGGAFLLLFVAATLIGMKLALRQTSGGELKDIFFPQPPEIRETVSGGFLAREVALSEQDYEAAAHFALQALKSKPDDQTLQSRALQLLILAGQMQFAQEVAEKMARSEKKDRLATIFLLASALQQQDFSEAQNLLEVMPPERMNQFILPIIRGWVVAGNQSKGGSGEEKLEDIITPELDGFLSHYQHYQLALMQDYLGNAEAARTHYLEAAKDPARVSFRIIHAMANFFLRQGEREEAEKWAEIYAINNPDSELNLKQELAQKRPPQPLIDSPASGVAEVFFTAASLLFGDHINQESLIFARLALMLREDFASAQLLLASMFEQRERYSDAVAIYQKMDPGSRFYKQSRVRIALNYHAAGRTQQAKEILRKMIKEQPDQEEAILLLSDLFRYEKDYMKAVALLERIMQQLPEKEWSWEFIYKYAIALERSGQWEKAEQQFVKALEMEPDQSDILNYLGYSMLEQGEQIHRAFELIERAYDQRPDAAHIIDSMGWAYYMKGEYEQAVDFLEQALEGAPQDPTVNEHLGDVYWRLGRRREARYQWERALTYEAENTELIKRKLQHGLPDAEAALTPTQEGS